MPIRTTSLTSTSTIGFIGAGQLARMSALQAFRFGFRVASYSDRPDGEPLQWMTPLSWTGGFDDVDRLTAFAEACDVVTLENEFVDSEVLSRVAERSGTPILPSPESFRRIEDKRIEKETFRAAGLPVAPFAVVSGRVDLEAFGTSHGWPFLLKSSKGGYDGYGNRVVETMEDAMDAFAALGGGGGREILAEAFVPFVKELAVQVARNHTGIAVYPCCETVQTGQICTSVICPAPVDPGIRDAAESMAVAAVEAIDGVGLFAFEFFLTADGMLVLNESAPRPHNSGHHTIESVVCSQFENHVRAVSGLPLGSTRMRAPAAVMVNLLGSQSGETHVDDVVRVLGHPDAHLHLYGKAMNRLGRKMGHLTVLAPAGEPDAAALHRSALALAASIGI